MIFGQKATSSVAASLFAPPVFLVYSDWTKLEIGEKFRPATELEALFCKTCINRAESGKLGCTRVQTSYWCKCRKKWAPQRKLLVGLHAAAAYGGATEKRGAFHLPSNLFAVRVEGGRKQIGSQLECEGYKKPRKPKFASLGRATGRNSAVFRHISPNFAIFPEGRNRAFASILARRRQQTSGPQCHGTKVPGKLRAGEASETTSPKSGTSVTTGT